MATIKDLLSNMIAKIHTKMDYPTDAKPHKQLVTDGAGSVVWEDKAFYSDQSIILKLSPTFDAAKSASNSTPAYQHDHWCGGTQSNDPVQVAAAKAMAVELYRLNNNPERTKWVFYVDDVRYESPKRRSPVITTPGGFLPFGFRASFWSDDPEKCIFEIYYDDGEEHILRLEKSEPIIKPIPPEFITGTELTEEDNNKVLGVVDGAIGLIEQVTFEETDPTVPTWAKESTKPTYSATEITAGTFPGEVVAGVQTPDKALLRNIKLVSTETTPSVNGEIYWQYE